MYLYDNILHIHIDLCMCITRIYSKLKLYMRFVFYLTYYYYYCYFRRHNFRDKSLHYEIIIRLL